MPSPQEARSRQTAMEAERWWWVKRLEDFSERYHARQAFAWREYEGSAAGEAATEIDALIAERTK